MGVVNCQPMPTLTTTLACLARGGCKQRQCPDRRPRKIVPAVNLFRKRNKGISDILTLHPQLQVSGIGKAVP